MDMDNRETSLDVVFEYTGVACSVPKDITTSERFKRGLQKQKNNCRNLRVVIFNNGLQKIEDNALSRCS